MSVKQKDPTESHHDPCLKNLHRKQQQFKKQKAILEQQIEFLTEELQEYKRREADNKRINESIMITYQQSENLREEHIGRSIKMINERHEEEVGRIKDAHYRQCRMLEDSLAEYKDKYEKALIEVDKKKLEADRKVLQIQRKLQQEFKAKLQQRETQYEFKVQMLNQKLKKAQNMAQLYQQFVQKRRQNFNDEQDFYQTPNTNFHGNNSQIRSKQNSRHRQMIQRPSMNRKQQININICRQKQKNQKDRNKQNKSTFIIQADNQSRQSRRSRLKDIQQNNIKDMRRLSVSRESVKHLTAKIQRAVSQLKGSNNYKLHERINQKLLKRL